METNDLDYFREILNAWLEALSRSTGTAVEGLIENDAISADFVDCAAFESARSTALRIHDRESRLIKKIRKSLRDIETGDYGICEACDRRIAIERLKARPIARQCIQCKTKQEATERAK